MDNEVIVRPATGSKHSIVLLIREQADSRAYQWTEDTFASLLDVEYLGRDCARELLEAYFWTRTFKFNDHRTGHLEAFLTSDLFGLQMNAADYVRDLQIQVRPLQYAMTECSEKRQHEQRKCCQTLEALATLRTTRTQVTVLIDWAQDSIEDARYMHCMDDADRFLLEVMRIVGKLKERGLRVKVALSTTWNDQYGKPLRIGSLYSVEEHMSEIRGACAG
jgi:hypothetical protein